MSWRLPLPPVKPCPKARACVALERLARAMNDMPPRCRGRYRFTLLVACEQLKGLPETTWTRFVAQQYFGQTFVTEPSGRIRLR